jgi:hypothetical protein
MLAEDYILFDISLIGYIVMRLFFGTSMKFMQHYEFFLSLVTGLSVTQNISSAADGSENPDVGNFRQTIFK